MEGKKVPIKYQYYQLCTIVGDEQTEYTYDLREWILRIQKVSLEERIREINGITGRLEDLVRVHNNEFYALNFMRLDVVSNTYILSPDTKARHVDLEEDEYIGKNTVVLYDPRFHVVMVQCNRGSYGVSAIENYINSFIQDGSLCYFRPIYYDYGKQNLEGRRYLKLDVRFANVKAVQAKDSKAFEKILEVCNQIECMTAHVEFGLGYNYRGKNELDAETMQGVIKEVLDGDNRSGITSAKVSLSDDQKSEIFDLFENVLSDKITYDVPSRGELLFATLSREMAKRYEGVTRAKVNSILQ